MKAAFKSLVLFAFAILVYGAPAHAAVDLTGADVEKFVAAIDDVETFSLDMEKDGKNKALEEAIAPKSGDTAFEPYEKGVVYMKEKLPEDYKRLGDITSKHGFSSQEDWARISDTVMHTYMALRFEKENPDALKQLRAITPEMKAQLPPPALEQLERQEGVLKSLESVSVANREAVKPHTAKIDEWLTRAEAEDKAKGAEPKPANKAATH